MKALLFCTLLAGSLKAEQSNWQVTGVTAGTTPETRATWSITLRNVSDRTLEVGEHWSSKGKASANFCRNGGKFGTLATNTIFSEACHQPQTLLTVEPGKTVTAVVPRATGFDEDSLSLVILEGKERVVVAPLSQLNAEAEKAPTKPSPAQSTGEPAEK